MKFVKKCLMLIGAAGLLMAMCFALSACGDSSGDDGVHVMVYGYDSNSPDSPICYRYFERGQNFTLNPPDRFGYRFVGWYTEANGGRQVTSSDGRYSPSANGSIVSEGQTQVALYARWEPKICEIVFKSEGGSGADVTIDIVYGASVSSAASSFPVPTREGYRFNGWYTRAEGGRQMANETGAILSAAGTYLYSIYPIQPSELLDGKDHTLLYAQWTDLSASEPDPDPDPDPDPTPTPDPEPEPEPEITDATFVFQSGNFSLVSATGDSFSAPSALTYQVGTVLWELPPPKMTNAENCATLACFEGWYLDATLRTKLTFPYTVPIASEITLYAKYETAEIGYLTLSRINKDTEYEVSYSGDAVRLVIPEKIAGMKVTKIKRIQSTTLKELLLPDTIETIDIGAFEGCTALERVHIPQNEKLTLLPERCFAGCTRLTSVLLSGNLTAIGKEAFTGCSAIAEMYIPKEITAIAEKAFYDMHAMKAFLVAENSADYCSVDGVLFRRVGDLLYLLQYPEAKEGTSYTMPDKAVQIMDHAFRNAKIASLDVGSKLYAIGSYAFENCENLVKVTLKKGATPADTEHEFTIGEYAFKDCGTMKALIIERARAPRLLEHAFEGVSKTFSVYVPTYMKLRYEILENWRDIKDSVYSADNIFDNFAYVELADGWAVQQYLGTDKNITIQTMYNGKKIVAISDSAFAYSDIESVTLHKDIKEIGEHAFYHCSSLRQIILEGEPPVLGTDALSELHSNYIIYIKNTIVVFDMYKSAEGWSALYNSGKITSYSH